MDSQKTGFPGGPWLSQSPRSETRI